MFCEEIDLPEPDMQVVRDLIELVDVDCLCKVHRSALKLGATIPILRDFMVDKTRDWTEQHPPLYLAVGAGNDPLVKLLLETGAHPNVAGDGGVPLNAALGRSAGARKYVDQLLQVGADAHAADLSQTSDFALIQYLMEKGGNGSTIDLGPFIAAGDRKEIDALLAYGPDLSKVDPDDLRRNGDAKLRGRLLDLGMPTDIRNDFGKPWLHIAIQEGDHALVKELLARGANPNIADDFGGTALAAAIDANDVKTIEMLVDAGANAKSAVGPFDETPLWRAVTRGADRPVLEKLISYGADVNQTNTWGESPLQKAIKMGDVETVQVLVEHGARMPGGKNPSAWAQENEADPAVIEYLKTRF